MADSPISQSVMRAYSAGSNIPVRTTEGIKKFDKFQKNLNSNSYVTYIFGQSGQDVVCPGQYSQDCNSTVPLWQ